jgi:hypothetical protein
MAWARGSGITFDWCQMYGLTPSSDPVIDPVITAKTS